jgi:hypothetical protein
MSVADTFRRGQPPERQRVGDRGAQSAPNPQSEPLTVYTECVAIRVTSPSRRFTPLPVEPLRSSEAVALIWHPSALPSLTGWLLRRHCVRRAPGAAGRTRPTLRCAVRWGKARTDQPSGEGRLARPAPSSRLRGLRMRWAEGHRFDLTDWRLTGGAATPLFVAAGLVAYALYRPGPAGGSYVVAGLVTILALLAVLLTLGRSLVATMCYAGLLVVVGALFVRSQLRRGALAPPIEEWTIAVAVLCGAIALTRVALRALQTPDTGRPPSARMTAAGIFAALVLVVGCLCMPGVKYLSDGSDTSGRSLLSAEPTEEELIPLPADTELVQSSPGVYAAAAPAPTETSSRHRSWLTTSNRTGRWSE